MTLAALTKPWAATSYGFLDASAKRELRRKMLKAIAVPGCQMPYASREVPMARGWGTGGLQVTLTLVNPQSTIKVIDQGADDGVNAASIRRFISRVSGAAETWDTLAASIVQSRHRVPEETMREDQILVLQVPNPEPLRGVEPNMSIARQMHADADYGRLWLTLYEQIVRKGRIMQGAAYPSLVNGRHVMTPSPIPRWDVPKLNMAKHLTFLSAGREKRLHAVPPYTRVEPLVFSDRPYRVEDHAELVCRRSGIAGYFMNEIPQDDGGSIFEVSDSNLGIKAIRRAEGEAVEIGETWYRRRGVFGMSIDMTVAPAPLLPPQLMQTEALLSMRGVDAPLWRRAGAAQCRRHRLSRRSHGHCRRERLGQIDAAAHDEPRGHARIAATTACACPIATTATCSTWDATSAACCARTISASSTRTPIWAC